MIAQAGAPEQAGAPDAVLATTKIGCDQAAGARYRVVATAREILHFVRFNK